MLSLKIDGGLVRQARERNGLSVRQLAEAAGCSHWNIYSIEGGRTQPSAEVYKGICDALGAEHEDLCTPLDQDAPAVDAARTLRVPS